MEKKIHELITREGSMDNISIIIRKTGDQPNRTAAHDLSQNKVVPTVVPSGADVYP